MVFLWRSWWDQCGNFIIKFAKKMNTAVSEIEFDMND